MRIRTVSAGALTAAQIAAWSALQQSNPLLASPFMRPEFTLAVAAVRPAAEVALLEEGDRLVGVFPFERGAWNVGRPIGGPLSDYHGPIAAADLPTTAAELVRSCGLSGWRFDHLPAGQALFQAYQRACADSPFMEIEGGLEPYRKRAQSNAVSDALRKGRKLEREWGPLRLDYHTEDRQVFERLREWKSAQYHRTKAPDVLGFGWTVELLDRIRASQSEEFSGVLSALYAGDHLVAVHLGMRTRDVLHCWFPTYDLEFGKYSPGILLLLECVRRAPELGLRRIELGRGDSQYKRSLMTGSTQVAEGCVCCDRVSRIVHDTWPRTRDWLKASPLRFPVKAVGRCTRLARGWMAFR